MIAKHRALAKAAIEGLDLKIKPVLGAPGKYYITNMYVEPETGKIVIEFDDTLEGGG